jgi:hypothetical protein
MFVHILLLAKEIKKKNKRTSFSSISVLVSSRKKWKPLEKCTLEIIIRNNKCTYN